jgi:hypothetical protein
LGLNLCASLYLATSSSLASYTVEALCKTAFFDEVLFKGGCLAVQKVAGYREQGENSIGCYFGIGGRCGLDGLRNFEELTLGSSVMDGSGPGCDVIGGRGARRNEFLAAFVVSRPLRQAALAQVVFIVQPQFLQAGPRHVRELKFGFL